MSSAEIIKTNNNTSIQVGHTVTLKLENKEIEYQILGASEINLSKNIISHQSPLGQALLGKEVGELVGLRVGGKVVQYKVLKIE